MKRVFGPYLNATSSLTYAFLMSLPLLILYEVLIVLTNPDPDAFIRLSTDVWIKSVFAWLGFDTLAFTAFLVLVLGVFVYLKERPNPVRIHGRYVLYMVLESAIWALLLAMLVSKATSLMFAFSADGGTGLGKGQEFALSLGAGLYEELVFRVLLVPVLVFLFTKLGFNRKASLVAGILVGALLFSAMHYMGSMGDLFTLSSFTYRFLFGVALNGLLLTRGFGITAWTHSLYNVMVATF